jgi:hypothetical protein
VVLLGWCHVVEGKAKEARGGLAVEAERKKTERKRGPAWARHAEKKRRGV